VNGQGRGGSARMPSITRINETIRLAADGLEAVSTGGFGRRTGGDTCDELVRRATDRARAGDEEALRFLYLRYSPAVFSYVRAMLGDEHAAEDVTQTVFARLAMRLRRYKSGEASFGTWIARVAHNAAIDHVRAQRLVPCEEVHDPAAAQGAGARERLNTLRQALKPLREDRGGVVVLRLVVGMSAS